MPTQATKTVLVKTFSVHFRTILHTYYAVDRARCPQLQHRILDQAALPLGWTQWPWAEEQEISVLPACCRHLYKTVSLSSVDGKTRIVEVEYESFIWLVTKDAASEIVAPGSLEGILATLRSNSERGIAEE